MTFESVDYGDEDEATVPEPADSWYDDAPITDEQIEAVRRDLDTPVAQRGAAFAPFVVRKLLAEIDRLNTVLDANRVVRNAAESSCRTLKGVVHLLKTERTQLRSELADARGAMEILRSSDKEQCTRAETAERELAEMRAGVEAFEALQAQDVPLVTEVCSDFGNDEGPRSIRRLYAQFEGRIVAAEQQPEDGDRG